jgi:uracil phosphoribosyltransferase
MIGQRQKIAHVHVIDHPLVQDSLTHLRDKTTQVQQFRWHSDRICQQLFFEATRSISVRSVKIVTPITPTNAIKLDEEVILVPVLRSGVCMLFGALQLLPKSKVGFAGMERDENTAIASQYYWKFPKVTHKSVVIITDPMIATGGSILHILRELKTYQPKEFRIVCVIAAPEGIQAIHAEFPGVEIYAASVDSHINAKKYITPGLGDYGDRYYGTE